MKYGERPPLETLTQKTSPEELRARAAEQPGFGSFIDDFLAEFRAGDELWYYGDAWHEGLALVRAGAVVMAITYLHADPIQYDLLVRWAGGDRPSNEEIAALRKVDPHLRDKPMHEVRDLVSSATAWRIVCYPIAEYERRCKEMGLKTERVER